MGGELLEFLLRTARRGGGGGTSIQQVIWMCGR